MDLLYGLRLVVGLLVVHWLYLRICCLCSLLGRLRWLMVGIHSGCVVVYNVSICPTVIT